MDECSLCGRACNDTDPETVHFTTWSRNLETKGMACKACHQVCRRDAGKDYDINLDGWRKAVRTELIQFIWIRMSSRLGPNFKPEWVQLVA